MNNAENKFGLDTVLQDAKGDRQVVELLNNVWSSYLATQQISSAIFDTLTSIADNNPRAHKALMWAYQINGKISKILKTKPKNNYSGYLALWQDIGRNNDHKKIDEMIDTIDIDHPDFIISFQGSFGGSGIPMMSTLPIKSRGYILELQKVYKSGQQKTYLDSITNIIQRSKSEYLLQNIDNIMSGMNKGVIRMGIDRITNAEITLLESIVTIMYDCSFQYGYDKVVGRLKLLKEGRDLKQKTTTNTISETIIAEEQHTTNTIITPHKPNTLPIIKKIANAPLDGTNITSKKTRTQHQLQNPPSRVTSPLSIRPTKTDTNQTKDTLTATKDKSKFPYMETPLQQKCALPSLKELEDTIHIVDNKLTNESEVREKFGIYSEELLGRISWYIDSQDIYEKLHSECVRKLANDSEDGDLLKIYPEGVVKEMLKNYNFLALKEYILILCTLYNKKHYALQLHKAGAEYNAKINDITNKLLANGFTLSEYYTLKMVDVSTLHSNVIIELLQKLIDIADTYEKSK